MKILFIARHFGCFRNFERPIAALAARGHTLKLMAHQGDVLGGRGMVDRWAQEHPGIAVGVAPPPPPGAADGPASRVRLMIDYLRYLEPAYRDAEGLLARAVDRTPRAILQATATPLARSWPSRRLMRGVLRWAEAALPPRADVVELLTAEAPDVVLFTPLISLGSEELDYLSGAQALRLPTVFCVWSWDNLSSKSLLRRPPDVVTVWNDVQKREAVDWHGVPADRVVVTGAQNFDHWFDLTPARSREEFCAQLGLPADRPLLLWVCSALFKGSPAESSLVVEWLRAIRAAPDARVREAAVLIRPHPSRLKEWTTCDLAGLGPVAVWGANPIDRTSQQDYFESMHFARAVVGVNTSAFLEAAAIGRPVMTILLPEFFENQEGTLHFRYLLNVAGGLLDATRSLKDHVQSVTALLDRPEVGEARSRTFVKAFVRPQGLEHASTPIFVDAVERAGALGRRPALGTPPFAALARRFFARAAASYRPDDPDCAWLSPREAVLLRKRSRRLGEQRTARIAARSARLAARQQRSEEKAARIRDKRRRQDRERAASHSGTSQ